MIKMKSLIASGSIIIGVSLLIMIYFTLISLGVIQMDNFLVIETESLKVEYNAQEHKLEEYNLKSGKLQDGHQIIVNFTGSQTDAGESDNTAEVKIVDQNGRDVSHKYNIETVFGTLLVERRPIVINTNNLMKIYDGEAFEHEERELEISHGSLVPGHTISHKIIGNPSDIGEMANTIDVIIYDENGNDVTLNYEIMYDYGILTILSSLYSSGEILKEPFIPKVQDVMKVKGDKSELVYLRDLSFGDFNGLGWEEAIPYEGGDGFNPLNYTAQALMDHHLPTNKLEIEFLRDKIPYLTPYFSIENLDIANDVHLDGPLTNPYTVEYISYQYHPDEVYQLLDEALQREEHDYRQFVHETYLQIDEETKSALLKYAAEKGINEESTELILDIQQLIQNGGKYNLNFSPIPDNVDNIVLHFLLESQEGICQHFASAGVLMYRAFGIPARYVTGYLADVKKGRETILNTFNAHAWVEIYIDGMGWVPVEVTAPLDEPPIGHIFVKPKDEVAEYDGNPLVAKDVYIEGFEQFAAQEYTYEVSFSGSQTEVGMGESYIENFIIYDPDGNDVTHRFSIIDDHPGELKVVYKKITFKTEGDRQVYNSEYLTNSNFKIVEGLVLGHSADIKFTGRQKYVGSSTNTAVITIYDENGNDVTDLYFIVKNFGKLEVTPREIVIQTDEATKVYDGTDTPLVAHGFTIIAGTLNEGEYFKEEDFIYTGEQIGFGTSDNTIDINSIKIYNGDEDVTSNYSIIVNYGKLTVTLF